MLYAILCYNSEDAVAAWPKDHHDQTMQRLRVVQDHLARQGRLGPVARLLPTTAATTLRKGRENGVRGALLSELGRRDEARQAFDQAIRLASSAAEAAHIRQHLDCLQEPGR